MKYFYDANVGRTAHLWKVHDTYCRWMMKDSRGNRELHHDKGTREVCSSCASKWLELYPTTSATAQRYLQSQPSNSFERKHDGSNQDQTNRQTDQVHRGISR